MGYSVTYIDEFVDQLLNDERVCDIILPRITKRSVLEENEELGPRKSRLLDAMEGKKVQGSERERSVSRSRSGSRSASRSSGVSRNRSPSEAGSHYVSRSPSRSPIHD